ncbi:MAG: S-methyl-5-thioribose kinase [Chloroflexi bacterium]|nr:S-methyl-5-thioribose kinase [Chloroflexota bacterium]
MTYQALDEQTVIDYIKKRPAMARIFSADAQLTAKEVGDGNINMVFVIENQHSPQSAVIKQALPYVRILGDTWELTRDRIRFETQSLLLYNQLTSGLAPEVYDHDEDMSLVIMENLNQHQIMRRFLVARRRAPDFAEHISTFMARTLFFTSDLYLDGRQKKELQAKYINPHMCKIQEDFVFTHPFMTSEENRWNPLLDEAVQAVRANRELKLAIAEMKESYMTHGQALIHSDLHTGSIMLNEHDTRVIDSEFAFYGPMGFDVGAVLENLVLNCLSHYAHTPDAGTRTEYQQYLLDMVRVIWNEFARKFDELWQENNQGELVPPYYWDFAGGLEAFADFRRRYLLKILHDSAGHGGCKMLRRMMGVVSVWDISSIEDLAKRAIAERAAIKIGSRWILERQHINTVDDLLAIVREEMQVVEA